DIEAKSAAITTERVWQSGASLRLANENNNPGKPEACPTITVRYRNVTEVHFRAVAWDWTEFLQKNRSRPEWLNDRDRKELMARRPVLEWSAKLPPTPDYKERAEQLPAPDTLKPGFYLIVASHDPAFADMDNQITYADVWVSELALVIRPHGQNLEGFVLEANSGEPVRGAEVMAWYLDNRGERVPNAPATQTDEAGFFSIPAAKYRQSLLRVRAKLGDTQHELATSQEYGAEYWREDQQRVEKTQTIFFTDRALYRPGQTVQYKGICVRVDHDKDNYETLAGQKLTVVFEDPNGKEAARAEHACNDYGSFSGSFTAPRDRVTGQMRLRVIHGPSGASHFNVEEYKRPKFRVTLDPPKVAPKLNGKASLVGKAESYTGAAVDGATVKWRVVREVRWPWWCWWGWRSVGHSPSQEIAHGSLKTATDGTFNVEFLARPDPKVSEKDEASFTFTIYADVTDSTGETRSADRPINVGFTALAVTLAADDWQTDDKLVELKIRTATLDDEPQPAKGTVKVCRLKEPARVHRAQLAERYYYRHEESVADEKKDLSDPNTWELAGVVAQQEFATAASGETKLRFKLARGVYRAMLETQDRFGKKVTARLPLQVLRPGDTKLGLKIPHLVAAPKWVLEPGEEFVALWGTGYDTGRAFVEIEHRHKFIQRFWTKPGQTQQQVKLSVTEAMRGGFTLRVTQVRENRAYLVSRQIAVPWTNKELAIKWEHFVSKLQPGQKETWTAVIETSPANNKAPGSAGILPAKRPVRNASKEDGRQRAVDPAPTAGKMPALPGTVQRAVAEMVATLYDESLDQFLRRDWPRRFDFFRHDHPAGAGSFVNAVKQFQHLRGHWRRDHVGVALSYRHFPQDLVANFWGYEFPRRRMMRAASVNGLMAVPESMPMPAAPALVAAGAPMEAAKADDALGLAETKAQSLGYAPADKAPAKRPDLGQVAARKNLNETAFFFPHLVSDKDGVVRMTFTMPEALTTWRFLGFAHDRQCRSGYLE
ncbi:MAG: hypothetical protein FJ388_11825, partial [Verrucomicrobia bacterium]|nr:hypothetical protein [Verrucomicrobiota bacterium]